MDLHYHEIMAKTKFEWDAEKDALNREKPGVSFAVAQYAFADLHRVIAKDDGTANLKNVFIALVKLMEVF